MNILCIFLHICKMVCIPQTTPGVSDLNHLFKLPKEILCTMKAAATWTFFTDPCSAWHGAEILWVTEPRA